MTFLIHAVDVFDGRQLRRDVDVTVTDGLISSIQPSGRQPAADADVVHATGCTLLPGLIDAHAHVFGVENLRQAAVLGVTTVIDQLADPVAIAKVRHHSRTRTDVAELRSAGTGATVPDGYGWYLVDLGYLPPFPTITDPDAAGRFVADRVAEGSDHLKILLDDGSTTGQPMPTLGSETIRELTAAAREQGLLTVGHALNADAARELLDGGIDVLGHLFVDRAADSDLPAALAERNVAVIPTLTALDGLFGRPHASRILNDVRLEPHIGEADRYPLSFGPIPLGAGARHDLDVPRHTLRALADAGVPILAGSDASNPGTAHGASLHIELELLVEAGLPAADALRAATSTAAATFGLSDRGELTPGRRADLLLVHGDPTRDITATRDIAAVWRSGQPVRS